MNSVQEHSVAVLMPTKNRPKMLEQSLEHLSRSNACLRVYVLDSSSPDVASANAQTTSRLDMDVVYVSFADVNLVTKLAHGFRRANQAGFTYAMLSGDDDLLDSLRMIGACGTLDSNPQISVILGEGSSLLPVCKESCLRWRITAAVSSKKWPFWALRRASDGEAMFAEISKLDIGSGLMERLVRFYDATQGCWSQAERPFLIRERQLHAVDEFGNATMAGYGAGDKRGLLLVANAGEYLCALEKRVSNAISREGAEQEQWVAQLINYEAQAVWLYQRHQSAKNYDGLRGAIERNAYSRLRRIQAFLAAGGLKRAI